MNIGIDIDGVLIDMGREMLDYGTKYCIEKNQSIDINIKEYSMENIFNWSSELEEKFWNKYLIKYVTETNPRKFAPQIIERLQEEGHYIYIITARNEYGMPKEYYGKMQELTKGWLKRNQIQYDKIIFVSSEEKINRCLENKIDIMIEDAPSTIIDIARKIKVIKFDCEYNKQVMGENIITAYSWYHIYKIITDLKAKK